MFDVTTLKVFEFENGEKECVIAKDYQEAYDFYKNYLDDEELEDFKITEVKDWLNIQLRCEVTEKQADGTYIKLRTMKEIAEEWYNNGYTGADVISTTVIY